MRDRSKLLTHIDHGEPKARREQNAKEDRGVFERVPELGISFDNITQQFEDKGVEKVNKPFDKLVGVLAEKRRIEP